jgi:hypothetical protein
MWRIYLFSKAQIDVSAVMGACVGCMCNSWLFFAVFFWSGPEISLVCVDFFFLLSRSD